MDIKEFVEKNNLEKCKNLIKVEQLNNIEKEIKIKFGNELKKYILEYGYLAYEYIELYGINSKQGIESDMVKQTLYLHKYFPKTINYIAVENLGDGNYYIVDNKDNIYKYISEEDKIVDMQLKLFKYIMNRFNEIL
ncbi:hypothetical protein EPJ70_01625 [Brachyspira aalborgi]|uniref:SMI1/KNR4 family protein n=1 Tax=Brachyspira aalborgi TaxID=29522 RepID=A0A5C8F9I7_9SPIR|nr:SMI1/KNR4 family protein [Brachyspira aalborgi]TXJ46423.1 hypothetical protein EPJ70_01625 [Brachyspira aalborgi]